MSKAYYNENNPEAAAWLRELIKAGCIAPGEVDERSIEDVRPDDLRDFSQCHFFAGIGVWSHALRSAGWTDDRPVWTGSCPCQPFSAAGKGKGFADERHLWPAFFHLIVQCRPHVVFGEQVASKDGLAWLDLVAADLEGAGYACGAVDTCAAGFGAPHIRQRLYWVADASSAGTGWDTRGVSGAKPTPRRGNGAASTCGPARGLADDYSPGLQPWERDDQTERYWNTVAAKSLPNRHGQPGPLNGFWGDADWLFCRDGKWRPTIPSFIALVDGLAVDMVRGSNYSCGKGQNQKEEVANASCTQGSTKKELPILPQENGAETNQRQTGGFTGFHAEEVLRQEVHGKVDGEGEVRTEALQGQVPPTSDAGMRNMWQDYFAACPPQERPAVRQHTVELDDIMRELPQASSLAKLHGDRNTEEALYLLHKRLIQESNVQHTLEQTAQVWASLGEEEKDRFGVGLDVRAWRRLEFFPLEVGAPARVGRLRGYGNGLVAPQAEAFVRAYMETIGLPTRREPLPLLAMGGGR